MATEEVVPLPLLPRPSLDGLEAACRERMAMVVKHGPARGFDTARTRAFLLAQCDAAFDLYLLAASAFDDNEEADPVSDAEDGASGTCSGCGERVLLTDWPEHRERVHGYVSEWPEHE